LRILYISGTDDARFRGGIEAYGNGLIAGIRERGHDVALLETGPAVYANATLRDYWPAAPFRQRYYFWKRAPHEDYRYQVALRRQTRALIASFRPDVIHSLHAYRHGAAVASNLPVMVSTYGLDVHQIPPVLGSLRRANVVHAISDFTAGLVKATCPEVARVEVIRWGITRREPPAQPPEFDVITVSRLVRRKNFDTVLKAIARIGDLRYAVVGDGPEMKSLRELVASLRLRNVTFFGSVSDEQRQALLSASRLFVMCPRTEPGDVEGLGLVYYEALGAGLPIIGAVGGGAPEAVGQAGIVVQSPQDPAEVGSAIEQALEPANYARLKARVAERQRDDTWDGFIDKFERVYNGMRRESPAPAARHRRDRTPTAGQLRIVYALADQDRFAHGGIETYGRELMAGMAARGHAVEVLDTTPSVVYQARRAIDWLPPRGFRRRYYMWKRTSYEDWQYHSVLARLSAKQTAEFGATVLHAMHLHSYGAIAGSRVPCVVTAHGLEVEPIPPVMGSAETSAGIHAVSNFTANLVRTRLPHAAPVTVITWGIRNRPPTSAGAPEFDLITVSRLVHRKNVDTVLRALESRRHLRYAVVGDGPELPKLRDLAASLGLTNVTFFGSVSEQQRHELLDRSRVFIMCPRFSPSDVEGLGLVYFEAFEAGLPVIAANNGGVPDAVGSAAMLVERPEDVGEVGRAIDAALNGPESARLASQVARRRQEHSWDAFLDAFEQLYQRVAERRSSANRRTLSPPR
jgi:glycosyltransferase involved in cell wall biosynthesis